MTKTKQPFGQASLFNVLDSTDLPPNIVLTHLMSDSAWSEFLSEWNQQSFVAMDLETAGKTSTKEALNPFELRIRLLQVGYQGKCFILDSFRETVARKKEFFTQMKRLLESDSQIQIFHNGFFDLSILRCQAGVRAKSIRDTMIISRMLNAGIGLARPSGLGAAVKQFLGVSIDKSHQTDDWSVDFLSNSQYLYAANDVIYTEKLFLAQCKLARKEVNLDLTGKPTQFSFIDNIKCECDVIPAFVEIFATGQPVDLEVCKITIKKYRDAINDLYEPLLVKLGLPYSAQSAKMHAAIKREFDISVVDKDNKPTTSSDALFLASETHKNEDLLRLSLTRSLVKLADTLDKLYESALQNNGFARGSYNSLGDKASGRSTCKSAGKASSLVALNLQNIPKTVLHPLLSKYNLPSIREVIRHSNQPMYLYDLSSSHARYAAMLSGDYKLIEVMELDDAHSYVTLKLASMIGKDWDMDYYEANKKTDKEVKTLRATAKTALYGCFNGGGGGVFYKTMLKDYNLVPRELCDKAKEALGEAFPVYTNWCKTNGKKAVYSQPIKIGYQTFVKYQTTAGKVYHVELQDRISKDGSKYQSINPGELSSSFLISIEAYAMKKAFTEIYHYLIDNPSKDYQLNSFTHDDISVTDSSKDKLFAQYTYDRIAYWFSLTLGAKVNSTMAPGDGNWKDGEIADYSQK